ncbi:putative transcriptional regulator [Desulfofundulus thermosubterraneus DSM 16057]|uniref:Putative transcriptional regulator n=1 Tax=Desulfofundulus thermosubterraneus DSM 16057 TaxID=1121432 RepID=A0A1M6L0B9_9FIRM|nr:putative transcriptional regulator [Desulfofundulus thermosubterraneus DSM 16057]
MNSRKKLGLTQEQVSLVIGISKKTYSHIETGRRNPSWEVAQRLEKFFGIPASELLEITDEDRK